MSHCVLLSFASAADGADRSALCLAATSVAEQRNDLLAFREHVCKLPVVKTRLRNVVNDCCMTADVKYYILGHDDGDKDLPSVGSCFAWV